MDDVNQPQGNGPQDHSSTEPSRFTPGGWPGESPAYGQPEQGQDQQYEDGPWLAGPDYPQPDPYQQPDPYHQQQPSGSPGPYPPGSWQPGPDPYQQQPGGPGQYAQQPGGPGPFAQQPDSPGQYAQQPGGPGPYSQHRPTRQLPTPGFPPLKPKKKRWAQNRKVRWGAGIAAAVVLGAGGTLAGLELTGGSSAPPANAAQAVALNSAIGYTTGCSISSVSNNSGSAAIGADAASLRRCLHSRLREVTGMYGEIAYHTASGTETLAFERGVIQSATGGQLTVKAQDGTTWTWDVGGSPIIRKSGKPASIGLLNIGMKVFVGGLDDSSTKDAKLILIQAGKSGSGKSGFGKKPGHGKKPAKTSGTAT